MRLADPGRASLRRAGRVAIVAPAVFAFYLEVVDLPTAAMFGAFGSFAMLAFADFGGAPWPRTRAFLVLTALGAVLVLVGSALNPYTVAAAAGAVVVATAARFVGSFGGYFQASVSPVILAYVLGATVPEAGGGAGGRVAGWVTAGVLAALAALILWPRRERRVIAGRVGAAARTLAEAVAEIGVHGRIGPDTAARVAGAVTAMERSLAQPLRPAGPDAHDVAFAYAVDQVRRIALLAQATASDPLPHDAISAGLAAAASRALVASATTLETGRVDDGLASAVEACGAGRESAVADATRRARDGEAPARVLAAVDERFVLRLLAFLSASLAANAATVVTGSAGAAPATPRPLEVPAGGGFPGALARLRTLIATHLVPTSTWGQESLRAGLGVGLAVAVALSLDVEHGFWVVLGTLSVLRSNAFSTGRSALDAAAGTVIGFAASAGMLALVGFDRVGLWAVLIAAFFLSAYAPAVIGFVVGQACFTVLVVALFNLIEPQGWRTGLVRVEDIAIGVTVSAVVALLFWPRRAIHQLRAAVVTLYEAIASALGPAFRGAPDAAGPLRAERRAHAAYESYLSEQGAVPPSHHPWGTLLATASQARGAIVALERQPGVSAIETCRPVHDGLGAGADDIARGFDALARAVADPRAQSGAPSAAASSARAVASLTAAPVRACIAEHAHDDGLTVALAAAFARDWLVALGALLDRAAAAAAAALTATVPSARGSTHPDARAARRGPRSAGDPRPPG